MAEAQGMAQLVAVDLLGPLAGGEPAAGAVVDDDVGALDRIRRDTARRAPGAADRQYAGAAARVRAGERAGDLLVRVLEQDGVDAVELLEAFGGGGGAVVLVADVGGGVVVPDLHGGLELGEAAARQVRLAGGVGPPADADAAVELIPALLGVAKVGELLRDRPRTGSRSAGEVVRRTAQARGTVAEPVG